MHPLLQWQHAFPTHLVHSHDGHAVARLAGIHQVVLHEDLRAARQLPGRRRLGQLLHGQERVPGQAGVPLSHGAVPGSSGGRRCWWALLQEHIAFLVQAQLCTAPWRTVA